MVIRLIDALIVGTHVDPAGVVASATTVLDP